MSQANARSLSEVKELVKAQTDLVEVIGRYTKLIRNGARFKGCCPFHKEKTPSFHVNPAEGLYYCFGCQAGGDVFTFLEKAEGLSFFEALKELAEKAHIELPRMGAAESPAAKAAFKAAAADKDLGFEILDRAEAFFRKHLESASTPGAREAAEYLVKRGISNEERDELGLGWAPESGSELARRVKGPDFTFSEKTGLVRQGQRGAYDFFRGRLMIPIRDAKGRVCAFSGRTLQPVSGENPKYKNSPETEWFKKKEVLYGLDRSGRLIRDHDFVCLVEGYFDQWAFHRHGVPAVAVMGTALGEDHLRTLSRYTKRVVLVLDADRAGIASTIKSIPLFARAGWSVSVFSGLEGKDPDEWLAAEASVDNDALLARLRRATEGLEWWCALILKEASAAGVPRLELFNRLREPWTFAATKAHRSLLADEIGRFMGLPPRTIYESLSEMAPVEAPPVMESFDAPAPVPSIIEPLGSKTPIEEAFQMWVRHWDDLMPPDEEAWKLREALFEESPIEAEVSKLVGEVLETGHLPRPQQWRESLPVESVARVWIEKALVGGGSKSETDNKGKLLILFKEVTSVWQRGKIHREISKMQSQLRSVEAGSSESSELLKMIQERRFQLETFK